jgi:hypothetical protein
MRSRPTSTILVAINLLIAAAAGIVTIVGFFTRGTFADILGMLAQWVTVIVGFALLVGLANLLKVHIGRVIRFQRDWFYSLVLVGSAIAVLGLGLAGGGPGDPSVAWVFRWIYQPLGAALFSLLAFFLTTALFRLPKMRNAEAAILLVTALVVIISQAPFSATPPVDFLTDIRNWLIDYPVLAAVRAILLGVAFGAIATSLRVLLGFDRPYME